MKCWPGPLVEHVPFGQNAYNNIIPFVFPFFPDQLDLKFFGKMLLSMQMWRSLCLAALFCGLAQAKGKPYFNTHIIIK